MGNPFLIRFLPLLLHGGGQGSKIGGEALQRSQFVALEGRALMVQSHQVRRRIKMPGPEVRAITFLQIGRDAQAGQVKIAAVVQKRARVRFR